MGKKEIIKKLAEETNQTEDKVKQWLEGQNIDLNEDYYELLRKFKRWLEFQARIIP